MNRLEEIRQVLFAAFKALHNASFPTVPISWPNFATVDTENLTGPFVSVQLSFRFATEAYDITSDSDIVRGELLISYLRPVGTGLTGSASYSDMLRESFCFQKVEGVTFSGLSVLDVSPAPGILGHLNILKFTV